MGLVFGREVLIIYSENSCLKSSFCALTWTIYICSRQTGIMNMLSNISLKIVKCVSPLVVKFQCRVMEWGGELQINLNY